MNNPETVRSLSLWVSTALRAAPSTTVALAVAVAFRALVAPAQAYGLAQLLDGIAHGDDRLVKLGAALIVASLFCFSLMAGIAQLLERTLSDQVHGYIHRDLLRISSGIPGIGHHEDPRIADKLAHVLDDVDDMAQSATYMMQIVAAGVGTCSAAVLLASVHPLLILLPMVGMARAWSAAFAARLRHQAIDRLMPRARVFRRIVEIAATPQFGVEIRSFGMRAFLLQRLNELANEFSSGQRRAALKGQKCEFAVRLPFGVLYGLCIAFAVALARDGKATPGDVALVVTLAPALESSSRMMAQSVGTVANMIQIFSRYRWLNDYAITACAEQTGVAPPPLTLHHGIMIREAEFRYPGSDRAVLSGINLFLPAGSTIAIVGENGAGKTTLVKLLARLYDVTDGTIEADGVDLRTLSLEAWRARVSACFQDFTRFYFTAGESIGIGDLPRIDDEIAVKEAAIRGGASQTLNRLPKGIKQRLGKEFSGGVDLSGGQWQRMALARACMRRDPLLLLLDEPTSALDPEAEYALFERFAAASRDAARRSGGITILVSHRFSTVRMADYVIVMDRGHVTEYGSHAELIAADGHYAELYRLQTQAYL
ncbi:ABC transporter ATP-binding protein [Streptomyces sp. CRB46]|uniref:ABC transporter ATP-binding protein n=1 Tax=Streptomyces sp. CRB46 TaxID=2682613 RepID=UPI001F232506|nr:ABC transporter ATP-binding protein [Streptomyces sp. CRB46]